MPLSGYLIVVLYNISKYSELGGNIIKLKDKFLDINILLLFKAGIGSTVAIFLADQLSLKYSVAAGIITLLTIQSTRKETFEIALKRVFAFIIATILAYIIFNLFGYTVYAFGIFIFIFTAVANLLFVEVGIVMNAVLVTHFLLEQNMQVSLIINESLLLIIGVSVGIIVNLVMPSNKEKIKNDQIIVEDKISGVLKCLAQLLINQECTITRNNYKSQFKDLNTFIDNLLNKAYQDAHNTLIRETRYQISYLEMRKHQVSILRDIFESIENIKESSPQSKVISSFVAKVADEFAESNNVLQLSKDLEGLFVYFQKEVLPQSREEFENRAILFSVLKDLDQFLKVKKSFIEKL